MGIAAAYQPAGVRSTSELGTSEAGAPDSSHFESCVNGSLPLSSVQRASPEPLAHHPLTHTTAHHHVKAAALEQGISAGSSPAAHVRVLTHTPTVNGGTSRSLSPPPAAWLLRCLVCAQHSCDTTGNDSRSGRNFPRDPGCWVWRSDEGRGSRTRLLYECRSHHLIWKMSWSTSPLRAQEFCIAAIKRKQFISS